MACGLLIACACWDGWDRCCGCGGGSHGDLAGDSRPSRDLTPPVVEELQNSGPRREGGRRVVEAGGGRPHSNSHFNRHSSPHSNHLIDRRHSRHVAFPGRESHRVGGLVLRVFPAGAYERSASSTTSPRASTSPAALQPALLTLSCMTTAAAQRKPQGRVRRDWASMTAEAARRNPQSRMPGSRPRRW